jgi:hypothetical protein
MATVEAATGEGAEEIVWPAWIRGRRRREFEVVGASAFLAVTGEQEQAPVDREPDREAGDEVERVDRERSSLIVFEFSRSATGLPSVTRGSLARAASRRVPACSCCSSSSGRSAAIK